MSDALVEEIRARADLSALAGEHTSLRRVGKSFRGPCPLHGGEGPNFSVDPDKGIFKCFVCGEGGDVFAFVMKRLGLDFPEAVRHVGERVGIQVPEREERQEDPWAHLREVTAFAEEWFQAELEGPRGEPARRYLESRGLPLPTALDHGLGYAPDAWRALKEAAAARSIREESLLELGLLATSERAEEPYDRFRNRLIFSIHDLRDRPAGFGGRSLGEVSDKSPKYINSPDSPIFHKGELLYGLHRARHEIRREGFAAVVEGYTDVLALHVGGLPVAVAGLGTAFTEAQARSLSRYTERAYLLFDSDPAGLRATFRAADVLLAAGVHPLVVTLPSGEDPDSLVRGEGIEAVRRLLRGAVDVLERKLQILERQGYLRSVEGRRRAVDGLLSTLRAVRDPALADIYLDRAAERTGVRRETLVREVASGRGAGVRGRGPEARRQPPHRRSGLRGSADPPAGVGAGRGAGAGAERNLLLLLVRDEPDRRQANALIRRAAAAGVSPEHFREATLGAIYRALLERARSTGESAAEDAAAAGAGLPTELREPLEALRADTTELTDPEEIFQESVRRLLSRPSLERLRAIDRELELADEAQARELLAEKERITRELREAGVRLSFLQRVPAAGGRTGDGAAGPREV